MNRFFQMQFSSNIESLSRLKKRDIEQLRSKTSTTTNIQKNFEMSNEKNEVSNESESKQI